MNPSQRRDLSRRRALPHGRTNVRCRARHGLGRADKGLFITTGSFSRDGLKEAVRDGAPPIDLIDGDQLAEKLKELKLGVVTELIEDVSVNEDWFKQI